MRQERRRMQRDLDLGVIQSPQIRRLAELYAKDAAPPGSLEHMLACTTMWFAHRAFENRLAAALKPFNLSPQAVEILIVMRVQPQSQMTFPQLRTLLGLHPASLTYVSDRLVEEGLIERLAHHSDRRVVVVQLTDKGVELLDRALVECSKIDYGFPHLTRNEALRLAEILGGLWGA
jgi:DNA-binding MarR family transcriptional regulator